MTDGSITGSGDGDRQSHTPGVMRHLPTSVTTPSSPPDRNEPETFHAEILDWQSRCNEETQTAAVDALQRALGKITGSNEDDAEPSDAKLLRVAQAALSAFGKDGEIASSWSEEQQRNVVMYYWSTLDNPDTGGHYTDAQIREKWYRFGNVPFLRKNSKSKAAEYCKKYRKRGAALIEGLDHTND